MQYLGKRTNCRETSNVGGTRFPYLLSDVPFNPGMVQELFRMNKSRFQPGSSALPQAVQSVPPLPCQNQRQSVLRGPRAPNRQYGRPSVKLSISLKHHVRSHPQIDPTVQNILKPSSAPIMTSGQLEPQRI